MNTQLGSTMMVVSGCFVHPSAAPVAGRSLAGRAFSKVSPRYRVSLMVSQFNRTSYNQTMGAEDEMPRLSKLIEGLWLLELLEQRASYKHACR